MLPLAFKLEDRPVLVLGAGAVGARKARELAVAGARVSVIASEVTGELPASLASLRLRPYESGDVEGFVLVISATADHMVNDLVVRECAERGIWLNVVDDLSRSSFYFTALHREGDVTVSVSTGGSSPALAKVLRDLLRDALPKNVAEVARQLSMEREEIHIDGRSTEDIEWRSRILKMLGQKVSS